MHTGNLFAFVVALPTALACLGHTGGVPKPTEKTSKNAPITVPKNTVYDGGWKQFDRSPSTCKTNKEQGREATAFILEDGATLRNAIIGGTAGEGVYCLGRCNIEFVWFQDVCEDAITFQGSSKVGESWVIGGGAYHASDKVIQHNSCGKVNIINFYAEDYGKVYRSCGTCSACKREVYVEGVTAKKGGEVVGITKANGDSAKLVNVCSDHSPKCQNYKGAGVKDGAC